jgi:hypothetical protein
LKDGINDPHGIPFFLYFWQKLRTMFSSDAACHIEGPLASLVVNGALVNFTAQEQRVTAQVPCSTPLVVVTMVFWSAAVSGNNGVASLSCHALGVAMEQRRGDKPASVAVTAATPQDSTIDQATIALEFIFCWQSSALTFGERALLREIADATSAAPSRSRAVALDETKRAKQHANVLETLAAATGRFALFGGRADHQPMVAHRKRGGDGIAKRKRLPVRKAACARDLFGGVAVASREWRACAVTLSTVMRHVQRERSSFSWRTCDGCSTVIALKDKEAPRITNAIAD